MLVFLTLLSALHRTTMSSADDMDRAPAQRRGRGQSGSDDGLFLLGLRWLRRSVYHYQQLADTVLFLYLARFTRCRHVKQLVYVLFFVPHADRRAVTIATGISIWSSLSISRRKTVGRQLFATPLCVGEALIWKMLWWESACPSDGVIQQGMAWPLRMSFAEWNPTISPLFLVNVAIVTHLNVCWWISKHIRLREKSHNWWGVWLLTVVATTERPWSRLLGVLAEPFLSVGLNVPLLMWAIVLTVSSARWANRGSVAPDGCESAWAVTVVAAH